MPLGGRGYLDIRQGDAHAWSEVWLPGEGWRSVDPSRWVPAPLQEEGHRNHTLRWLEQQWWGLDLGWTRLWSGFDAQEQGALLGLAALQRRSLRGDAWRRELDRALAPLARRGLAPLPGETLPRFAARLEGASPELAEELRGLIGLYQRHRFAPPVPAAAGEAAGASGAGRRELRRRRRRLARLGRRLQRQPR
jgi:hypothetical protein